MGPLFNRAQASKAQEPEIGHLVVLSNASPLIHLGFYK